MANLQQDADQSIVHCSFSGQPCCMDLLESKDDWQINCVACSISGTAPVGGSLTNRMMEHGVSLLPASCCAFNFQSVECCIKLRSTLVWFF